MLGIIPPEPLGESPPFPISRLTKSRPLFCGMENWGGGLVDVAPTRAEQNQAPAMGKNLKATFIASGQPGLVRGPIQVFNCRHGSRSWPGNGSFKFQVNKVTRSAY